MAKKSTPNEVAPVEPANVVRFEISADIVAYASRLGADLTASLEDRADRAAEHMNRSQRHELATGLLLASIKAECEHGQFLDLLAERGFEERSARRAMQYAQFILSRSDDEREFLIGQPKTKVLALAGADAEVIDDLLADGESGDIGSLSVRDLRQRIRDLEAQGVDAAADRDAALAENKKLTKQLNRRARDAEDNEGTPAVIADARAEVAELVKKAELSLASIYPVAVEVVALTGHEQAHAWVTPSLRLMLSGLVALRLQADGLIGQLAKELGDDVRKLQSQPDALAFLDENELKAVAEEWLRLVPAHQYEADLRKHERDAAKPKGKGRPKSAPVAPGATQ